MLTLLLSLLLPLAAGEAEPACLLQKPKAPTQLSLLTFQADAVVGWDYLGWHFTTGFAQKWNCETDLGTFPEPNPTSCASQCDTLSPQPLAFYFDESTQTCHCCDGIVHVDWGISAPAFARAVPSWHSVTVGKTCAEPGFTSQADTLSDCGLICESQITEGWFIYNSETNAKTCQCCSGLDADLRLVDGPAPEAAKTFVYRKEDVPGWDYLALGSCTTSISPHPSISSLQECSEVCASDSSIQQPNGFVYDLSSQNCECCFGLLIGFSPEDMNMKAKGHNTVFGFAYARADPFWKVLADHQKCVTPFATSFHDTLADCAKSCEPPATGKWLVYGSGPTNQCDCCGDDGLATERSYTGLGGLGYHLAPLASLKLPAGNFRAGDGTVMDHHWQNSPLLRLLPLHVENFVHHSDFPLEGWSLIKISLQPQTPQHASVVDHFLQRATPKHVPQEDSSRPAVLSASILQSNPSSGAYGYLRDEGVGVYGDPHVTALDGSHYLLLSQGTFSLWHLHGLSTEFQAQDGFKKVPVEWEILTHYSGHQSFTKGLLLVDRSAGVQRQVLEITSADCQWRAHTGAEWSMVSKPGMISVADGQDFVTGFNMTKAHGNKHRGRHASGKQLSLNQVHFSMNSKDGATDIAVLTVSCRPKRNLNLNLVMKRRSDYRLVEGELAGGKKLAALETSDSEFNIKGKWQDVGGSDEAAAYLQQMDEDSKPSQLSLLQSCNAEEKAEAKITCSKYLGSLGELDRSGFFFNDCVYDVCHGAGEVAAELAAELLTSASV